MQIQLHAGMGGSNPGGLIGYTQSLGAKVQAYRPLGQGRLMRSSEVRKIAERHRKTPAQARERKTMGLAFSHSTLPNPQPQTPNPNPNP